MISLILLSFLELLPLAYFSFRKRIDYLCIILAAQFVGYHLPVFIIGLGEGFGQGFAKSFDSLLTPAFRSQTNALLLCTALIGIAFYGARALFFPGIIQKESSLTRLVLSRKGAVYLFCLQLISFAITRRIPHESVDFWINAQFVLTVLIFCISVPEAKSLLLIMKILVLLGCVYSTLFNANLGFMINLVVIWICVAALERKPTQWIKVALLVAMMFPLQWIKGDYRAWISQHPDSGLAERAFALMTLRNHKLSEISEAMPGEKLMKSWTAIRRSEFKTALDRARDISLQITLQDTPSRIPFWGGRSYAYFFTLFIPDWIGPNRLSWNLNNEWGRLYGVILPSDTRTQVVFSYLAEAYMNFGFFGLYLIAFLSGLLFAFVERLSVFDLAGHYSFTFICFLMPLLSYQENASEILVKLVFTGVVLALGPNRLNPFWRRLVVSNPGVNL